MSRHDATGPVTAWRDLAESWTRASRHLFTGSARMVDSVRAANRAMLSGVTADLDAVREDGTDGEGPPIERITYEDAERYRAAIEEMRYDNDDWEFERSTEDAERLGVGDRVTFSKTVTDADVRAFAEVSGDTNRLHLDDDFAAETRFGRRIVHGTLLSGLVSAALARLPGLTVYLSQDIEFLRPADIDQRLSAVCEVVEDLGEGKYRLTTAVENEAGETVIDGEAVVLVDDSPDVENTFGAPSPDP